MKQEQIEFDYNSYKMNITIVAHIKRSLHIATTYKIGFNIEKMQNFTGLQKYFTVAEKIILRTMDMISIKQIMVAYLNHRYWNYQSYTDMNS